MFQKLLLSVAFALIFNQLTTAQTNFAAGSGISILATLRDQAPSENLSFFPFYNGISGFLFFRVEHGLKKKNWVFAPEIYALQKSGQLFFPQPDKPLEGFVSMLNWGVKPTVAYHLPFKNSTSGVWFSAGVFADVASKTVLGFGSFSPEPVRFGSFGQRLDFGFDGAVHFRWKQRWELRLGYYKGLKKYAITAGPGSNFPGSWRGRVEAVALSFGYLLRQSAAGEL